MITPAIALRTLFVRGDSYATATALDIDGKQYIVTAHHIVGNDTRSMRFYLNEAWAELPVTLVGTGAGDIDVVVFATDRTFATAKFPLPCSMDGIAVGQELLFAGFPYKNWGNVPTGADGRPIPYIKRGMLTHPYTRKDGVAELIIDATNNEGFSGGPVFWRPGSNPLDFCVAAIVSKFQLESLDVLSEDGEKTRQTVQVNTGLMIAYGIDHAIELARRNPIGPTVPN